MIAKRNEGCGSQQYKYPGELYESDDEINGGDVSSELSEQNIMLEDIDVNNSVDMSWLDSSDGESFNSDKLIDGYKDFIMTT